MTKKQRIREWQKTMRIPPCVGHAYANDAMEIELERQKRDIEKQAELIKQQQEAEPCMFRHEEQKRNGKSRMDIIGQNGNDGDHYEHVPDGRWNWYGDGESDATSMDDDPPSAAEDCARNRGSYEI